MEGGVSNADFGLILGLDGLDRISDLYLDNDVLTGASLQIASTIPNLKYVFIDCDKIIDDAILRFESRFPKCSVIPYQRNLHGPPTVFLGEPPG
jgi:hypothetical protein